MSQGQFGERLREWREQQGLTQAELARRVGVRQQSVSEWEAGDRQPSNKRTLLIDQALGLSPQTTLLAMLGDAKADVVVVTDPRQDHFGVGADISTSARLDQIEADVARLRDLPEQVREMRAVVEEIRAVVEGMTRGATSNRRAHS